MYQTWRMLCCFCLSFFVSLNLLAQNKSNSDIERMAGGVIRNLQAVSRESIFVHTDKWFYVSGETIWFKAYCINSFSHRLDRDSKTIYLDLVDNQDKVVRQLFLNNQRLMTAGNIVLPDNLKEGDYWLRAYSMDMLDHDSSQIFVKHVYIFNGKKPGETDGNNKDQTSQVSFFPEGGAMIDGTDQVIGIRTSDEWGRPISVSGYITNDEDSVKAKFTTSAKGLAKVGIYLSPEDKYTAHIKEENGTEASFVLPAADPRAARLSIIGETDSSILIMVALGDSLFKYNEATTILGFSRDRLCYAATGQGMYQLAIPKKSFPGGENNLLLFNKQQLVLSERTFYNEMKSLVVDIRPDRAVYGDRERVNLDVKVADANGLAQTSLFSITVTDDQFVTQPPEKDEVASIPADNVDAVKEISSEERALILLTRKKRFAGWEYGKTEIHNTNNPAEGSRPAGLYGRALDKSGRPQNNLIVTMFSKQDDQVMAFGNDTTNQQGQFNFALPNGKDSNAIQLSITNLAGQIQDVVIEMDPETFPKLKTPESLKLKFFGESPSPLQYFKTYSLDTLYGKGKQWLNPVTVGAKRKKPVDEYVERKRASPFSKIITSDAFAPGIHSLGNAVLMAPGVHLFNGLVNIGGTSGFKVDPNDEPLLVIDGTPILKSVVANDVDHRINTGSPLLNYLDNYPISNIDFIEILSGPEAAIYGTQGGKGVILVYTLNRQREEKTIPKEGLKTIYAKGYANTPAFTGPDYSKENEMKNPGVDQRPTIYWNGNVLTDDQGKATLSFFTSDRATTYTVTIQGITLNGDVIYKRSVIQRK